MTTDEWNIGSGDPMKDILGKGLIVHQGTDDFVSQPSGDAGLGGQQDLGCRSVRLCTLAFR